MGDILLEVNGHSLAGCSHEDAIGVFKLAGDSLSIVIKKRVAQDYVNTPKTFSTQEQYGNAVPGGTPGYVNVPNSAAPGHEEYGNAEAIAAASKGQSKAPAKASAPAAANATSQQQVDYVNVPARGSGPSANVRLLLYVGGFFFFSPLFWS